MARLDAPAAPDARRGATAPAWGLVLGILGLTALGFAAVLYVLDPKTYSLSLGNLIVGVVGVLAYLITHRRVLRERMGVRTGALWFAEGLILVGLLFGLIVVNYFGAQLDTEWDFTKDQLHSLQPQSIEVAKALDAPVQITGFFRPTDTKRTDLEHAVSLYRRHSPHLNLRFISPDQAGQAIIEKYELRSDSPRIVFEGPAGRMAKIRHPSEEAITNALIRVARLAHQKLYFLTGHQEPALADEKRGEGYGQWGRHLRNEGYQTEPLLLIDRADLPEDASVVIASCGRTPMLAHEQQALKAWIQRGGRLLVLHEPGHDLGLDGLLRSLGIGLKDDLIVEPGRQQAAGAGPETIVVRNYEVHPITQPLGDTPSLFPLARSITPRIGLAQVDLVTLVRSSDKSWGEVDFRSGRAHEQSEADTAGPVPIALAATKRTATAPRRIHEEARVVVFGDCHFPANQFLLQGGNRDLAINTINWLAGEDERITLRPRQRGASRLTVTEAEYDGIVFFSVNFLPLSILALGLSIWAVRRRQ